MIVGGRSASQSRTEVRGPGSRFGNISRGPGRTATPGSSVGTPTGPGTGTNVGAGIAGAGLNTTGCTDGNTPTGRGGEGRAIGGSTVCAVKSFAPRAARYPSRWYSHSARFAARRTSGD